MCPNGGKISVLRGEHVDSTEEIYARQVIKPVAWLFAVRLKLVRFANAIFLSIQTNFLEGKWRKM